MNALEKEEFTRIYHSKGLTVAQIAEELNCHKSTIHRIHKRMKLTPHKLRLVKYTEEEKKEIIKMYLDNMTIEEIQVFYPHLKVDGINYMLRTEGLTRRNGKRSYLNENYFENIDSEEKAYFLGLLYADGSVQIQRKSENGYSYIIRLELSIKDRYIIEKFAECIETNLTVKDHHRIKENGEERVTSYLSLASKKMFDDLWELGKRPMKVDTCLSIPELDKKLMNHFIRGYFDGDGTVYQCNDKYHKLKCCFYGTNSFLSHIREELSLVGLKVNHLKITDQKLTNVSLFTFTVKETVYNFYKYLYHDATIYMQRRKDKFDSYFNE